MPTKYKYHSLNKVAISLSADDKNLTMTTEEALNLIEILLQPQILSNVQQLVFRQCWQGQTYAQIALSNDYDTDYIKYVGSQLWKLLSQALEKKVAKSNIHSVLRCLIPKTASERDIKPVTQYAMNCELATKYAAADDETMLTTVDAMATESRLDIHHPGWAEAVDTSVFYGRSAELLKLQQWIVSDRCRLIAIVGMGGVGKTVLGTNCVEQLQHQFNNLIWRSLRNAPAIEDVLADLILLLSNQQEVDLPKTLDAKLSCLTYYLRSSRCLVLLDNLESILQSEDCAGHFRKGYEGYGQLLRIVAETNHQSCVLVTSRELPVGLTFKENCDPVRSLKLAGLTELDAQHLLKAKGVYGSENETLLLCHRYVGNPLALKIAATTIQNLFDGKIAEFLSQQVTIFGGIRDFLDRQFNRLSDIEKQIMYWLAIEREPITIAQLQANIVPWLSTASLIEGLESLERRCLIEKVSSGLMETGQVGFTQQAVIMKYMTDLLIAQVNQEIKTGVIELFNRYALLKLQTKDPIREIQIRVIIKPIINNLQANFSNQTKLEQHLHHLTTILREKFSTLPGYGNRNLINIISQIQVDLFLELRGKRFLPGEISNN